MTLINNPHNIDFQKKAESLRVEMEELASKLRTLVLSQPPEELLGYLWGGLLLIALKNSKISKTQKFEAESQKTSLLFILEYVHAILSCFDNQNGVGGNLKEDLVKELNDVAGQLREKAVHYCIFSSDSKHGAEFGDATGQLEFTAKSNWVLVRGNRFQVLEEEFFRFILRPHDDALHEIYGVSADEVAAGIQAISHSTREGFSNIVEQIDKRMEFAQHIAGEQGISLEEAVNKLKKDSPEEIAAIQGIYHDLFYGGLCNLSRHTKLPEAFLDDLSFKRGENKEFFEPGSLCGTPLRTLPARIKPLIRLKDGFYAPEPFFVRDSAYRAIQRGLIERMPEYRECWNKKQKALTETAFSRLFLKQLEGATILNEVYYRDPTTGQWVENDALIIIDDVLLIIEAKAGIGAMQSPATDFSNHVRAIQGLVVQAYKQTKRLFDYINSAGEVVFYELLNGKYIEKQRIRLSNFRLAVPIGLTVENFSPFSAMCKKLPEIKPLLGKHPFISMSIDDLFVLNRFLPTSGELFHYLEVRQQVAGICGANLFDECDHLGAYISRNRFDFTLKEQLAKGVNMVTWDGFSEKVDGYFEGDKWLNEAPPSQPYPEKLKQLLNVLAKTRAINWLKFDALIRNNGSEARTKLAEMLNHMISSLKDYERRWLVFGEAPSLLIWLCRSEAPSPFDAVVHQAEVTALAIHASEIQVIYILVGGDGHFTRAQGFSVMSPSLIRTDFQYLMNEAKSIQTRMNGANMTDGTIRQKNKPRPNDPCPCGSGIKYKKCHGHT